jgi:hypothetical protein
MNTILIKYLYYYIYVSNKLNRISTNLIYKRFDKLSILKEIKIILEKNYRIIILFL